MTYRLVITADVKNKIKKMDKHLGLMLARDMKSKLDDIEDSRSIGKALQGNYKGIWRYCIGSYRVICGIRDSELLVLTIDVGHRKNVYRL